MPIPSLVPFTAGERITATKLNANTVTAIAQVTTNKPICHMTCSSSQSFTSSSTAAQVNLNTIVTDTDAMGDTVNNRINISTPGLYRITAQVGFATHSTGYRFGAITRNGTSITFASVILPAMVTALVTRVNLSSPVVRLFAGDDVRLTAWQNSGTTLGTDTGNGGCFLSAEWVGA